MKKFLTLLFFCFSLSNYAQNLSLEELITLRKLDLASIEERLSAKGWTYLKGEEATKDELGSINFAYKKKSYNESAESFCTYLYSYDSSTAIISLRLSSLPKYNEYMSKIKSYGCKLISSRIIKERIEKVYQGATTTFQISIANKETKYKTVLKTTYHLALFENSDYALHFSESE